MPETIEDRLTHLGISASRHLAAASLSPNSQSALGSLDRVQRVVPDSRGLGARIEISQQGRDVVIGRC